MGVKACEHVPVDVPALPSRLVCEDCVKMGGRWLHLRLCLQYPSQRMTWIGLFPFVLLHYLMRGTQTLQGVRLERMEERPHAGTLYYEYRNFCRWERLQERLAEWRRKAGAAG